MPLKQLDLVNKEWKDCGKGTLTSPRRTLASRHHRARADHEQVTLNTAFFGTQKFKKMRKRLDTLQFPAGD